jgi:hypothetical protein
VTDEVPETHSRARAGDSHHLPEQIVNATLIQPLADVRQCKRVNAVVLARSEVLGVAPIHELQPVEPAPHVLAARWIQIGRYAAGHVRRICS